MVSARAAFEAMQATVMCVHWQDALQIPAYSVAVAYCMNYEGAVQLTFLDARATVATVSTKLVRCSSLMNWLS